MEENGEPSINSSNPVEFALLQHGREKIGVVSSSKPERWSRLSNK
jgi:hypothetical protein